MILPNDATVAVVDGEKLRLFRNKGVEPRVHLIEETVTSIQPVNQGSGARHRSTSANPTAGGWMKTTSRRARLLT